MDWRLRGLPPTLWRKVRARAGETDIKTIVLGLLTAYVEGRIDPLAERDAAQAARGALGGAARSAGMNAKARSALASRAAKQRWKNYEATK